MSEPAGQPLAIRAFEAMGTRFECVLGAFDRPVTAIEAAACAESVERLVRAWHERLSVFDPASAVSALNRLGADGPVRVGHDLFALVDRCVGYTAATRGAFDVAVGSLMRAHGFRGSPATEIPNDWGADGLRLEPETASVSFARPGVALDFGAIAKGFVLDLARDELADLGVTSALLHGGTSSVLAIGVRPDGDAWRIRLLTDDPSSPVVELADAAMSVSSLSGRTVSGRSHVMDPATGLPADGATDAACVVGSSGEVCEAWSTALLIDPGLAHDLPEGYRCFLRTQGRWRSPETAVCSPGPR